MERRCGEACEGLRCSVIGLETASLFGASQPCTCGACDGAAAPIIIHRQHGGEEWEIHLYMAFVLVPCCRISLSAYLGLTTTF